MPGESTANHIKAAAALIIILAFMSGFVPVASLWASSFAPTPIPFVAAAKNPTPAAAAPFHALNSTPTTAGGVAYVVYGSGPRILNNMQPVEGASASRQLRTLYGIQSVVPLSTSSNEIYRTAHWIWFADPTIYAQNKAYIDPYLDWPEQSYGQIMAWLQVDPGPGSFDGGRRGMFVDSSPGLFGWAGGGNIGLGYQTFSVIPDWPDVVIPHEMTNVFTGDGVTGSWPFDWWADGRSPFPAMTAVKVEKEFGHPYWVQHDNDDSADADYMMFRDALQGVYGWPLFQEAFAAMKADQVNLENVQPEYSSTDWLTLHYLRSHTVAYYLSRAAGTDLSATLNNGTVGVWPPLGWNGCCSPGSESFYPYSINLTAVVPVVQIQSPAGAQSQVILLTATASDPDWTVQRVSFYWSTDGSNFTLIATDTNGSDGWSTSWDTATAVPEQQTAWVEAVATDMSDFSSTSISAPFTVDNTAPGAKYYVTVQGGANGGVAPPSGWHSSGVSVTIVAAPNRGYLFQDWAGTGSGSYTGTLATTEVSVDENLTETASFYAPSGVEITVSSSPATGTGYVSVDSLGVTTPDIESWDGATNHTLAASSPISCGADCQYVFVSWTSPSMETVLSASFTYTTPAAAETVTANYQMQYMLTTNAAAGGTVTPETGWQSASASVEISASSNGTVIFSGWTGTGSGSYSGTDNPATITMDGPVTETADFAPACSTNNAPTPPTNSTLTWDDFSGSSLDPYWTVVNGANGNAVAEGAGCLSISAAANNGLGWGASGAPMVLSANQTTDDFDFRAKGAWDGNPTAYRAFGIIAYTDDNNWMSVEVAPEGVTSAITAVGGSLNAIQVDAGPDPVYLRILRSGGTYIFYYSADGAAWTLVHSGSYPPQAVQLGFYARSWGLPLTSSFDWAAIFTGQSARLAMAIGYQIVGGGTPTAPTFSYVIDGVANNYTLTGTATGILVDAGSAWSVTPNPLSPSNSSEQWYSNQTLSGSVSATEIVFTFYHQYLLTMEAGSGGTLSPSSGWQDAAQMVNGNTLTSTYPLASDYLYAQKLTRTSAGTLQSISFYSGGGVSVGVALYSDIGGAPGSPLTSKQVVDLASAGPNTAAMTPGNQIQLSAGTSYWIVFEMSDSAGVDYCDWVNDPACASLSPRTRYFIEGWSYGTAFPDPWSGGIVDDGYPAEVYWTTTSGAQTQISANPNPGYSFSSWTGSGPGSYSGTNNPAAIMMNGPLTETANFNFTAQDIDITITSIQAGSGYVAVDGSTITTPQTYTWTSGSSHTVAAVTPVSCGAGCQRVFVSWSDAGAQNHTITVPDSSTTYTANFQTQYYLTMSAGVGGTVFPSSGWQNSEAAVQISANAADGYAFAGWTGNYTGTDNPATVTMNGPITETALFGTELVTNGGFETGDPSTWGCLVYASTCRNRGFVVENSLVYSGNFALRTNNVVGTGATIAQFMTDGPLPPVSATDTFSFAVYLNSPDSWAEVTVYFTSPSGSGFTFAVNYDITPRISLPVTNSTVGSSVTYLLLNQPVGSWIVVHRNISADVSVIGWPASLRYSYLALYVLPNRGQVAYDIEVFDDFSVLSNYYRVNYHSSGLPYAWTPPIAVNGAPPRTSRHIWLPLGSTANFTIDPRFSSLPWGLNYYDFDHFTWNGADVGAAPTVTVDGASDLTAVYFGPEPDPILRVIAEDGAGNPLAGVRIMFNGTARTTGATGSVRFALMPCDCALLAQQTVTAGGTTYRFDHWSDGSAANPRQFSLTANTVVHAVYGPSTVYNAAVQITVATNQDGPGFLTVDGQPETGNRTYQWTLGSVHDLAAAQTVSCGSGCQYVFAGWSDGEAASHAVTASNQTAYTTTFVKQYFLAVRANPTVGGAVTPAAPGTWVDEGTAMSLSAASANGYTFTSWTGVGSGSYTGAENAAEITVNGPTTEVANFATGNQVTEVGVTFAAPNLGSVSSGTVMTIDGHAYSYGDFPLTFSWEQGSSHSVSAAPTVAAGDGTRHIWDSWAGGGDLVDASGVYTVPASASAVAITANYRTQFRLVIALVAGGNTDPEPGTYWYDLGASVQIAVVAQEGYSFSEWILDGVPAGNASTYAAVASGPHNLQAVFVSGRSYMLVVETNPPGLQPQPTCLPQCSGLPSSIELMSGTTITITAPTVSGFALREISAFGDDGTKIDLIQLAPNSFALIMPAGDVHITVTYRFASAPSKSASGGNLIVPAFDPLAAAVVAAGALAAGLIRFRKRRGKPQVFR